MLKLRNLISVLLYRPPNPRKLLLGKKQPPNPQLQNERKDHKTSCPSRLDETGKLKGWELYRVLSFIWWAMLLPPYCPIGDVTWLSLGRLGLHGNRAVLFTTLYLWYIQYSFGRVACNKIMAYQCLKEQKLKLY